MKLDHRWHGWAFLALFSSALLLACSGLVRSILPSKPDGTLREIHRIDRRPTAEPLISMALVSELELPGSAMTMAVCNHALYAALSIDGLAVLDISDPGRPRMSMHVEGMLDPKDPEARVVIEVHPEPELERLLVLDRVQGLCVYDAKDPLAPRFLWSRHVPGGVNDRAVSITRVEDFYYLSCGGGGLLQLRVDFNSETPVSSLLPAFDHTRNAVFYPPHWLLVSDGYDTGMQVLDLEEPAAPRLVRLFQTGTYTDRVVPLRGSQVVLNNRALGFTVADMSNPCEPFVTTHFNMTGGSMIKSMALWRDRYLIVGNQRGGGGGYLTLFDLSDPEQPRMELWVDAPAEVNSLALNGDFVYAGYFQLGKIGVYRLAETIEL